MSAADNPALIGGVEKRDIRINDYDPAWPERFRGHAERITRHLGDGALGIEHVGSTSVPGLAAKPVVDILVVVQDSANEDAYLPQLEAAGYVLRVREPDWEQHRMFRTPELDVHVHALSPRSREVERLLAFRDRLRVDSHERQVYEATKRMLASRSWPDMNAYAEAKTEVIEQILANAGIDIDQSV
jgi:GrpB-like predicted nucleotidyltransferase (UPF0157 family)